MTVELASPDGLLYEVFLLFEDDTTYAAGYSEAAFSQVQVGDSESRVRELLGGPLEVKSLPNDELVFIYTFSPNSGNYRRRAISLVNGAVREKISRVWID